MVLRIKKSSAAVYATLLLEPHNLTDSVVLVADRDAVWNLWQTPLDESKHRTLGFWSKALPSTADNYSAFKKQLLVCYWAFVEMNT